MPKGSTSKSNTDTTQDTVDNPIKKTSSTPSKTAEKFSGIADAFFLNTENNVTDWLIGSGFQNIKEGGAENLASEERGSFADEMRVLSDDYAYDTLVRAKESDQGDLVVITAKRSKGINKSESLCGEIEMGPTEYISLCPEALCQDGPREYTTKAKIRRSREHKDIEARRALALGGALSATPEAKQLLGHLLRLRAAHMVQLSAIALKAETGKATLKKKHVNWALRTNGIRAI